MRDEQRNGQLVAPLSNHTQMIQKGFFMFEKLRIKEHMEVADANGQHVGTVDEVQDEHIKLTRTDSDDHRHHYLPLDAVDKIADNRIYLKLGTKTRPGVEV